MRQGTRRRRGRAGFGALCAGAALLAACGSDDAPTPTGRSMAGAPAAPSGANDAPVIESVSLDPASPRPGHKVKAIVRTSDPNGDAVQIGYQWHAAGRLLPDVGPELVVPDLPKGSRLELRVVASDGRAESRPSTASGRVGNEPPELVAVVLDPPGDITVGNPVVAIPQAQDPDGDAIEYRYSWRVNGATLPESSASLDTSTLRRGDGVQVRVVASDGESESDAIESPPLRVANAVPKIVSKPGGFDASGRFVYAPEVQDPDGDRTLRFRLAQSPDGMTVDSLNGQIEWRPTAAHAGSHTVELVVDDLQGGSAKQRFELTVGVGTAVAVAPAPADASPERDDVEAPEERAPQPASQRDEDAEAAPPASPAEDAAE